MPSAGFLSGLSISGHKNKYVFGLKICGLILDVIGSILVSVSQMNINKSVQNIHTKVGLNKKAEEELQAASNMTMIGIICISVGFVLIFGEEIVSSLSLSVK